MARNNNGETGTEISVAEVIPMPIAPFDDGNREFPVPLQAFLDVIKNTELEVWSLWLKQKHGAEAHTVGEWHNVLAQHFHKPAHPSVL